MPEQEMEAYAEGAINMMATASAKLRAAEQALMLDESVDVRLLQLQALHSFKVAHSNLVKMFDSYPEFGNMTGLRNKLLEAEYACEGDELYPTAETVAENARG